MSENLSLKEAERRAWTLYFEDGLWDIFLGLLFLGGGLRGLTDSLWFYFLILAGILVFVLGRKYITLPRVGEIKFGPIRERRRRTLLILITVSVLLTFSLLLLPALGIVSPGPMAGLVFAAAVPLIFMYMAYLMDFKRLYGYALMVGFIMTITEMVGREAGYWAQVVGGLIALIIGLWHLVSFVRKYPLPDNGEFDKINPEMLGQTAEGDDNGRQ